MKTRTEKDAIGPVEVPLESYGGSFYTRAQANFQISPLRIPHSFKVGLAWIKSCAAEVNADLGDLPKAHAEAIAQAAQEFIEGKFEEYYDLDVYQAGAGTPFNMSLNEILANRANEILGGKKGEYKPLHPNNHVNAGQSSNDTIPTAIRLAALLELVPLLQSGQKLAEAFQKKSVEFKDMLKVGRTHLQDAVPVTLGQEFDAYESALTRALERLEAAAPELGDLGIGGTATGSGINTRPEFAQKMVEALSKKMGIELGFMNPFENSHSLGVFVSISSALRALSIELLRICSDLRLMVSGPEAGWNEIHLPEVEPGSSIMPGKVNPSVLECISMICVQVQALDHAIAFSGSQGQLELNWYTPLVGWDLLHQIQILERGMDLLRRDCIEGITANKEQMQEVLDRSFAMATALVPHLGYHEVAEMVNRSKREKIPFAKLVKKEHLKHIAVEKLTQPNL
ncbi:MAG: lyase family protein [Candidatus Gracilibacteria bacterium]|jgi:fumarate hydratase class II